MFLQIPLSSTVLAVTILAGFASESLAQPSGPEPFAITDNSFFVEEAFNQERGIFQNIFGWVRDQTGDWDASFTQEWPVSGMKHQFSYTIPFSGGGISTNLGGVLLNYRYQALDEGPGRPAFSPRLSLVLPTGTRESGNDRPGVQVNLPFSKQVGDVYFHWNAGLTWLQGIGLANGDRTNTNTPQLAGSAIWRTAPMFHLMLESVVSFADVLSNTGHDRRERAVTVSPGFRWGWNVGERQIVVGTALPITTEESETTVGVLTYFSYELPFGPH
jgi:hypothetical protein